MEKIPWMEATWFSQGRSFTGKSRRFENDVDDLDWKKDTWPED